MNTKKIVTVLIIGTIGLFFIASAWASQGGRTFDLEATRAHPDAKGTAVIDQSHVNIQARGLKPDSVYTVWFVNMRPKKHEIGAGFAPYMFRTDAWGYGNYTAPLEEAPFGKWSLVMVLLHPNGNPRDMKNMVGALQARL